MTNRICVYKDCQNCYFRRENSANRDVTLFAFPKDPSRSEQWRLLGQVHPKIGVKQLFMCSKHFDTKYMSINKNRRILMGEAMPFPYVKDDEDDNIKQMTPTSSTAAQHNYYINSSGNPENTPKEVSPNNSAMLQSFYINLDDEDLSIDKVVMVESTTTHAKEPSETDLFDKIEVSIVSPSRKRVRSRSSSPEPNEPVPYDDQLIDAAEVSMFKFKGEQYVQMSREYYLQEKRQLLEQLRSYKRILSNIKRDLMPFRDL